MTAMQSHTSMTSMTSATAMMPPPGLMLDDEASFEAFYDEHVAFVWRNLRRLGIPSSELEDVCQEVFVTVHRTWMRFEARGAPRSWLYGILRRVASHHRRGCDRRQRRHEAFGARPRHETSETAVAGRVLALRLQQFLEQLDDEKRDVFVLAELEELTAREISAKVGVGPNTVYSRLRAARAAFERRFGPLPRQRDAMRNVHLDDAPTEDERQRVWLVLAGMPWGTGAATPAANGANAASRSPWVVAGAVATTTAALLLLLATALGLVGAERSGPAAHATRPANLLAPAPAPTHEGGLADASANGGTIVAAAGSSRDRTAGEITVLRGPRDDPRSRDDATRPSVTAPATVHAPAPAKRSTKPAAPDRGTEAGGTGPHKTAPLERDGRAQAPDPTDAATVAAAPPTDAGTSTDPTLDAPAAVEPTRQPPRPSATRTEPRTQSTTPDAPPVDPSPDGDGPSRKRRAPKSERAEDPPPPPDQLSGPEIALLQAARVALDQGNHRRALARLREHGRKYRDSALSPERDASTAEAHCLAGRPRAARPHLQRLQRSGRERLAEQIRKRCR